MKKTILIIFTLTISLYYYFSNNNKPLTIQKVEDNKIKIANDLKLHKTDPKKDTIKDNLKQTDLLSLQKQYSPLILELTTCLKFDHCGMKPSKNDPFFDPSKTDGMKQLKKTLKSLLIRQKQSSAPILKDQILIDLFGLPSEEVQELALKVLLATKIDSETLSKILENSFKIIGEGKSHFYSLLQKSTSNPSLNQLILKALNEDLAQADGLTIVSISENLHELDLDETQWQNALTPLCKVKVEDESNWLAIRFHFNKYAKNRDFSINSDEFCP